MSKRKKNKITIFLSHSHKDRDKVRKIRDILEALECEPLIFFLKCLDDKNAELEQFIKDEIEARNIFVYCKSRNAEKSKWVKKELDYINSFDKKRLYTIDIENNFSLSLISFLQTIAQILKRNRIFISYSKRDRITLGALTEFLITNDYHVQEIDYSFDASLAKMDKMNKSTIQAINEGIYLFVYSNDALQSDWWINEVEYTLFHANKDSIIIPVYINKKHDDLQYYPMQRLFDKSPLEISVHPTDEELDNLLNHIITLTNDVR